MADDADFDLAVSPGHLLHRAQQFAADRFSEATGGVEITQRQFAVLCAVKADEGLTQTRLVQATGIDRSTLAELVTRMAAKGLLLREKAPGDARANAVRFTDEGRKLYATVIAGATKRSSRRFRRTSAPALQKAWRALRAPPIWALKRPSRKPKRPRRP